MSNETQAGGTNPGTDKTPRRARKAQEAPQPPNGHHHGPNPKGFEVAPDINVDAMVEFLSALEPKAESHEFCWFATHDNGEGYPRQTYAALPDVYGRLRDLNAGGYGIFLAVNEMRPTWDAKGSAKRPVSAVTRIRAVFGDFDDPATPLPAFHLEPSIIVATSPGKHHVYWLLDPADPLPVDEFDSVQKGIINRYKASGADKSMLRANHVMRLPGSLHCKREPRHLVTILAAAGHRYTAAQLRATFPYVGAARRGSVGGTLTAPGAGTNLTASVVAHNWGEPDESGMVITPCPWSDEHSTEARGRDSSAAYWMPAERNGWRGWFECKHAHCQHRRVQEFDRWVHAQVVAVVGGAQ